MVDAKHFADTVDVYITALMMGLGFGAAILLFHHYLSTLQLALFGLDNLGIVRRMVTSKKGFYYVGWRSLYVFDFRKDIYPMTFHTQGGYGTFPLIRGFTSVIRKSSSKKDLVRGFTRISKDSFKVLQHYDRATRTMARLNAVSFINPS